MSTSKLFRMHGRKNSLETPYTFFIISSKGLSMLLPPGQERPLVISMRSLRDMRPSWGFWRITVWWKTPLTTDVNYQDVTEFTRYLKIQNSMLRQKSRIKWLDESDSNIAYFHGIIKDKRRKLAIRKIMDDQNQWLEGNNDVAEGAIRFYQQLFSQKNRYDDFSALNSLERCITDEDNSMLIEIPSL